MINKKNVLGKTPEILGIKDAIHTAIVSVRAAEAIKPGSRCGINKDGEAEVDINGPGVADPFRKNIIKRGEHFWLLLAQDEVPNVKHVWEHPEFTFDAPTKEPSVNPYIKQVADGLGVTIKQLMDAAELYVDKNTETEYPGNKAKTLGELEELIEENIEQWDFWTEWAEESLYEFDNMGTECCPEYDYPSVYIFTMNK